MSKQEHKETLQQNWYNSVDENKADLIRILMEMKHDIFYKGLSHHAALTGITTKHLTTSDQYKLKDRLNNFLIGSKKPGSGFIAQILKAEKEEELRALLNSEGSIYEYSGAENAVDAAFENITRGMKRTAWSNLSDTLNKHEREMALIETEAEGPNALKNQP